LYFVTVEFASGDVQKNEIRKVIVE